MSLFAIALLVLLAIVAVAVLGFVLKLAFWAAVVVAVIAGAGWLFGRAKAI
ncbi:hypothetical protein [Ilumatobacter coccineus]|uniref:Uncharacterized protein n=1 Tax=Ilumatobacter coccineus (strain NBRC 103263 / KCTC 29153 / YM16-304) TaxID=1313172 RepID=A0A6C7E5F1_ILUCY|nr:hypothetical protein [Ilumatobacter coccineus]BAN01703.1 hypothetical protein YM304_13890 [Ilumatobacter coccineus YM16-304]